MRGVGEGAVPVPSSTQARLLATAEMSPFPSNEEVFITPIKAPRARAASGDGTLDASLPLTPVEGTALTVRSVTPLSSRRAASPIGMLTSSPGMFLPSASPPPVPAVLINEELLRARYPRFLELVDAVIIESGGSSTPELRVRQPSWVLQVTQEILDGRFSFEVVDTGAGRKAKASIIAALPPHIAAGLSSLPISNNGKQKGAVLSISMPQYTFSHLYNTFGIKRMVAQTAWDLVYNLEVRQELHATASCCYVCAFISGALSFLCSYCVSRTPTWTCSRASCEKCMTRMCSFSCSMRATW